MRHNLGSGVKSWSRMVVRRGDTGAGGTRHGRAGLATLAGGGLRGYMPARMPYWAG